jgi:SAM-dependent methyltransferase
MRRVVTRTAARRSASGSRGCDVVTFRAMRRTLSAKDLLEATSFHGARALLAAASLGVFDALAGRRATAGAVARRIGGDPAATLRLLAVLVSQRLVEKEGGKYRLAPGARDLLTTDGAHSMAALLRHRAARFKAWALLDEAVRAGGPVVVAPDAADDPLAVEAAHARRDMARRWAPVLAGWLDLGGARSLLVFGDGTGVFAEHFARRDPRLALTVVDTPASVSVGRDHLRGRPEAARIRMIDGSPPAAAIPRTRFDAAFLCDALHHHGPEATQSLLARIRKAIKPGGLLVVRDRFHEGTGPADLTNLLYDLQLLLTTREGRCHAEREAADAMRAAGFTKVAVRDPGLGDASKVLLARA